MNVTTELLELPRLRLRERGEVGPRPGEGPDLVGVTLEAVPCGRSSPANLVLAMASLS